MKSDTMVVTAGRHPEDFEGAVNTPVFRTSTVVAATMAEWDRLNAPDNKKMIYGRLGTPTTRALEEAIAGARQFPDRLVPFCCIDPRTSYRYGRKGLVSMLKEYVDQGARGFGEHKVGLPIDDPKMMSVYEACDDLKLPVLFHCDDVRGTDQAGLPGLERILTAFPNVNFLGHGPGFWASISGDVTTAGLGAYPTTKVTPGGALDRLFDAHKNLWGDMSAGSGANAISRDLEFGRSFLLRRADRLLFGTDYLKPGQAVPQFELLAGIELPADVRAKIERENAAALLGLSL